MNGGSIRNASPDSVALAEHSAGLVAAYVHIPFCRRVCPYCDFAVTAETALADRYLEAVLLEIEGAEPFDRPLSAVAVGGGTPTALSAASLGRVVGALRDRFGCAPGAEVSIEANPEDLAPGVAEALVSNGFTRVSLGVQSFDDAVLADLGRAHSAAEATAAVSSARGAFDSVNVDLIFGSPLESEASWRASVERAVGLDVDHLSTYALTVERGTPLSRAVAAGAPAPDPDVQAERWIAGEAIARASGLIRYETSNHARPGHAVAYNLITWGQGEYAAFGNAAHRHRAGRRSWNVRRVDRYIERIETGASAESGAEELAPWDRDVERVMLGLRRAAGVAPGVAGAALVASRSGEMLVAAGVLEVGEDRIRIARPLLADEVSRRLLALDPTDC